MLGLLCCAERVGAFDAERVRACGRRVWRKRDDKSFGGLAKGEGAGLGGQQGYMLNFGDRGGEGPDGGFCGGVFGADGVEVVTGGGETEVGLGGLAGGGPLDAGQVLGRGAALPVAGGGGGDAGAFPGTEPSAGAVDGLPVDLEPVAYGGEGLPLVFGDAAVARGGDIEEEIAAAAGDIDELMDDGEAGEDAEAVDLAPGVADGGVAMPAARVGPFGGST